MHSENLRNSPEIGRDSTVTYPGTRPLILSKSQMDDPSRKSAGGATGNLKSVLTSQDGSTVKGSKRSEIWT